MTTGLSAFLIDFAVALATLVGTAAALWCWFMWLAGRATRADAQVPPRVRRRPSIGSAGAWGEPDLAPPSASAVARAEIAELETMWQLPPRRAGN